MDHLDKLRAAEALLKQKRASGALGRLRDLADRNPEDLPTLNRIGDLLARYDCGSEAIVYYRDVAARFANAGHLAKAIAIHKKILRLDAKANDSLIALGELYTRQKLPGEARQYLRQAADQMLEGQDFSGARRAYELLVATDPENPTLRAGLAEALAAAGEIEDAARELLGLGASLLDDGRDSDAEQVYRRCTELRPGHPEALVGHSRSLAKLGREEDALTMLEEAAAREACAILNGELVVLYESAGDVDKSMALLAKPEARQIEDEVFERVFRVHIERGQARQCWDRVGPVLESWKQNDEGADRMGPLLERLTRLEEGGHVPALERLLAHLEAIDDMSGAFNVLESLVGAYRAHGLEAQAGTAEVRLREWVSERNRSTASPPKPPAAKPAPKAVPAVPETAEADVDAPAVPLNRNDREFVTGRLTQAEILEKYGLADQAIEQVVEVTQRFPGHVDAQRRLVELLRATARDPERGRALVGLATAARASGDQESAATAVRELRELGPIRGNAQTTLEKLGLLSDPAPAKKQAAAKPAKPMAKAAAPFVPPVGADDSDDDVLIDFDADDSDDVLVVDMPAEEQERSQEEVAAAAPDAVEPAQELAAAGAPDDSEGDVALEIEVEDDDLASITAALETEFEPTTTTVQQSPAGERTEQSLSEVFAEFRKYVDEQVGEDDSRTHYDLGIGYMEMGLLDEAINEFEVSGRATELAKDSLVMLALCHRQKDDIDRAVEFYQAALDTLADDDSSSLGLRYDLAEALILSGRGSEAASLLRQVFDSDPGYRDVRTRLEELGEPASTT